ncbi:hypothetical protein LTR10_002026 [Elasticomyces elasticus]|nr:hypothetical protein LTR10_002026 [Elasticomyces elasticus]
MARELQMLKQSLNRDQVSQTHHLSSESVRSSSDNLASSPQLAASAESLAFCGSQDALLGIDEARMGACTLPVETVQLLFATLTQWSGILPMVHCTADWPAMSDAQITASIPGALVAMSEVARCSAKYTPLLVDSETFGQGVQILRIMKMELQALRTLHKEHWTAYDEIMCFALRINSSATLEVQYDKRHRDEGDARGDQSTQFALRAELVDNFDAALQIIKIICSEPLYFNPAHPAASMASRQDDLRFKALPKSCFHALLFATFFLLRYFVPSSRDEGNASIQETARNHVRMAYECLRNAARPDLADEMYRGAAVVETLSRAAQCSPEWNEYKPRTHDRLGASIMFDALGMANRLRSKPTHLTTDLDAPQQPITADTPFMADLPETDSLEWDMFFQGVHADQVWDYAWPLNDVGNQDAWFG